jgi:chromosome segregation ATPase
MKNLKGYKIFLEDLEETKNKIADDATVDRTAEEQKNIELSAKLDKTIENIETQRQAIIDKIKKIYDLSGASKSDPNKAKQVETQLKSLNDQLAKFDEDIEKAKTDSDETKTI